MPTHAAAHSAAGTTANSTIGVTVAVAAATFLLTASLTLLVQLVIVPRVETRKRREDRWERNVQELGELLTIQVRRLGQQAYLAQSMWRFLHLDLAGVAGLDQEKLAQGRRESTQKARQASSEFRDLIDMRMTWLADRIKSIASPAPPMIGEFASVVRHYWLSADGACYPSPELDDRTDQAFEHDWDVERDACIALIRQVERLADLPHPPRAQPQEGKDLLGGPDP